MAGENLSFDIVGHDRASGSFRSAAAAAGNMSGKMDLAAKSAYILQESLNKQRKAADTSVGATLALSKADKILADAEHVLADGALEADFALKREAEAAKKSGRAAVVAAAENRTLADSLKKIGSSSFFKPTGLGIAAALSPALIPLAGSIAGAVGAIGVSFGAAVVGAGLFGLAAKSVLTQAASNVTKLQALNLALNKATTAAQKKSAEAALKAFTSTFAPGYLKFLGQLETFQGRWRKISQSIAIPALSAWLGALIKGMPLLKTAVKPVADVFQLWGRILRDNFSDPAVMKRLQGMAAAFGHFSASQLTLVGGAIADIALGVFHLGKDLAGSGANFSAFGIWVNNVGSGFLAWSKSSKARADVQGFMHYLHQEGPVVGSILSSLGKILPGIFQGASTTGTLELKAIAGFLGLIANLPKSWQKPLIEAAGAILLLSKTGVLSVGFKLAGGLASKSATLKTIAGSLGMKLLGGALIVPATVMIIGSFIPKDTSKQAARDFKNQPGIIIKVSDFLHTTGMGAWVDQYFSHPIRAWAENSLPHFLGVAGTKIANFFTRTVPAVLALFRDKARLIWDQVQIGVLRMVFKITGYMGRLPGPLGAPFRIAHKSIGTELAGIQADAARTARQINADWQRLHGKTVTLGYVLKLPLGLKLPRNQVFLHPKGYASGTRGAEPGWAMVGERGPEMVHMRGGETVVPNHRLRGYANGVGDFAGSFPSGHVIGMATAALQGITGKLAGAIARGIGQIQIPYTFGTGGGGHMGWNPGAGVQQWRGLVLQALKMEGLSSNLVLDVMYQMMTESGGNPNAINLTDSNAAMGDPSRGLMQTIMSTFRAYHWPGTSWNIYNPLANIAAAINYGAHNGRGFGTGPGQIGSGHGYDNGGWLPTGLSLAYNGTGRPEQVIPHGGRGGAAAHVVLEVRTGHGATNLERALVEIIRRHVIVTGGGDVQVALGQKA